MPRGYRGRHLEALAWVICVVAATVFLTTLIALSRLDGQQDERRQQYADQHAEDTKHRAQTVCRGTDPARVFDCVYERVQASKEQAQGDQDLAAQQAMANWALGMLAISFVTTVISGAGLFALIRTIRQGQASLEHAQKVSDAELRPWLQIDFEPGSFIISKDNLSASFTAIVKNLGRTPAQNVRIGEAFLLAHHSTFEECRQIFSYPSAALTYRESARALLPGDVAKISRRARMPLEQAQARATRLGGGEKIANPIILVIAYYDCPGHDETSKTAVTYMLSKTTAVLGPNGFSSAPSFFMLDDKRVAATDIKATQYRFCEAT